MDGRPDRRNKPPSTNSPGVAWTGPEFAYPMSTKTGLKKDVNMQQPIRVNAVSSTNRQELNSRLVVRTFSRAFRA